ncbi:MAG TPA: hypothetical protein VGR88_08955, partial [Ktedonobacterales bacterium]|nr:hypothetical protein [Ktedonobacterales bacterium]
MSTDDDSARENGQWQVPGGQPANPGYQPPAGYPLGANSRPPAPSFPAAPLGSTPTPRPSPIERLRDTRGATGGKRATAHPDGAPSPIPRASALKANTPRTTGAAAAGTQVVQRFSGTGLTPRPVVARREDRARRATLVLASAAVLLLVVSALALFDPTSHFAGFGFALGQRVTQVKSDVPLILQGTEPPTPTLGVSTASPTATPNNGGGPGATATPTGGPQPTATAQATATAQPTATPQATATPVPTSTPLPTATPTVLPTGATVTFNATKQTVQSQPSTISSCPSGCDFGDKLVSGSQQFSHTASA